MDIHNLGDVKEQLEKQTDELVELEHKAASVSDVAPESLKKLRVENTKLKYQMARLERTLEAEISSSLPEVSKHSQFNGSIMHYLSCLFQAVVVNTFPNVENRDVDASVVLSPKFADYQCNVAMKLAKILKSNPREIASEIKSNLPDNVLIEKVEVAGAGFINIFLRKDFVANLVKSLMTDGIKAPVIESNKKVIIDMSSPNIAKEMHVGHLRSTIIGEAVSRLCEFVGHDVHRVNHLGDWGTQFGMLVAHLQDEFPNYKNVSPPIQDLQSFYKKSKKRFDDDPEFKEKAYACVVKLQSKEPDYIRAWQLICDVSRSANNQVYDRLQIQNLVECGESFYCERMIDVQEELASKNLLVEEEGRKLMFVEGGAIPLTIVKSDGGTTYDTSDMAALRYRLVECQADWVLYVVDAGQATHFQVIFACGQKAGWYNPTTHRVEHIAFGVVLGEDKRKFKTRSGETIRLLDLLNEGLNRSEGKLIEKGRDKELTDEEFKAVKEAVAYGCIKYADLSHSRQNDYVFSFDKMLDDKGNTAVYLQYAYVRIRSIARLANIASETIIKAAETEPLLFEHPQEWRLAKCIIRFPDVILSIMEDWLIHFLCEYLYELSSTFTDFYNACYCVEKDKEGNIRKINLDRLILCEATALTMKQGLDILGIQTLEKM